MRYILFLSLIACAVFATSGLAQTIDPYRRLSDPRAITYLDGEDAEPLQYRCAVGWPSTRDSIDDHYILASGEGAGIITHLWMQLQGRPDSVTDLKIYIDDSLVIHDHLYSFFSKYKGSLRAPLDSFQSGGLVCDVQMPFKKSFRITYYASYDYCCLFWAIGWRPVLDPVNVEVFSTTPSQRVDEEQRAAEEVYWSGESPWKDTPVETISINQDVTTNTPIERSMPGPGLITELHIKPSTYDAEALRNLWMEFYWDGSPNASVDVPLADFFGAGAGMRDVRSHPIRTQKEGWLTSYFPMPFAVGAKMRITNRAATPVSLSLVCKYSREPIDRTRMGYFEAQFNERKDLRYHVFHPVGYHQGRGRFVGMQLYLPVWEPGYFLEGDPIFHIDSDATNYIRYTGTEDYFNGGWFFTDGPFSLPFAGCTAIHTSLYRFHYMDAIDFKSSFELFLQHGSRNDFKAWYRTIGYFYNQWTPFWLSRDTVRYGEELHVSGTGYAANEPISIALDNDIIASITANIDGAFDHIQKINSTTRIGGHVVSVNGFARPEPLWVIAQPDVYFVRDAFPEYVNWNDTVTIHGTGFPPGKAVSIYLDTNEVIYTAEPSTDALGQFTTKVLIPYINDGRYHVVASTDPINKAISKEMILNTRSYTLEIENMWPPVLQEEFAHQDYMGYYSKSWSEQYYLFFMGGVGKRVAVKFSLPKADTFDISAYATRGVRFGDYLITLDNFPPVTFRGFEDRAFGDPIRSDAIPLGIHFLDQGNHYLTFECIGKDASTNEYLLGADNLFLRPVTAFQPMPVAVIDPPVVNSETFLVYPNPVDKLIKLFVGADTSDRLIDVELIDMIGVVRATYRSLPVANDGSLAIYLSSLPPGGYHLRISHAGVYLGTAAFVKN